jgi:MFS family permease
MASIAQKLQAPFRQGTFTALHNPNFRMYFFGQLISMSGTWMQRVALGYLVFQLTRSEFTLGLVACASGIPVLLVSPFAGVVVERLPRRYLLFLTQTAQMILAFILALLVFTNAVQTWHIFVLALLLGLTNAFDAPARQTIVADLVGLENLPSGIAVNSMIVNGSRVLGPAVAGLFLTAFGAAWCFLLNGVSFLAVLFTLAVIHIPDIERPKTTPHVFLEFREGLRFARHHQVVLALLLLAVNGGLFSWSIVELYPAFADRILHSPKEGLAILSVASGLGALIAGLMVTYFTKITGRGRYIAYVAVGTSLFMALMTYTLTVPLAALMSFIGGFCIISYFVTINTTLQITIPPEFRGRVLSLYTLAIMGFTPFGSLLLGSIAESIGTPQAMRLYAVVSFAVSMIIIVKLPALLRAR